MRRARRSCAGSSSELCGDAAQACMQVEQATRGGAGAAVQVETASLAVRQLWRTATGKWVPRSVADVAAQRQHRAWLCTSEARS